MVDDELTQLVATRGYNQRQLANGFLKKVEFASVAVMLTVICCGLFLEVNATPAVVAFAAVWGCAVAFAVMISINQTRRIKQAYRMRQHETVWRLLPDAVHFAASWNPLTRRQLFELQCLESNLLIREGRCLELEVNSRFLWAFTESTQSST